MLTGSRWLHGNKQRRTDARSLSKKINSTLVQPSGMPQCLSAQQHDFLRTTVPVHQPFDSIFSFSAQTPKVLLCTPPLFSASFLNYFLDGWCTFLVIIILFFNFPGLVSALPGCILHVVPSLLHSHTSTSGSRPSCVHSAPQGWLPAVTPLTRPEPPPLAHRLVT